MGFEEVDKRRCAGKSRGCETKKDLHQVVKAVERLDATIGRLRLLGNWFESDGSGPKL